MAYEDDIEERIRFLQIDDITSTTMQSIQSLIEAGIDDSMDKFYAHILQEPKLRKLFSDTETIDRARKSQKAHWLETLFTAKPGKAQFDKAEQIGLAHMRIGLTPSWYMSGYCFMLNQFVDLISDRYHDDSKSLGQIIKALNKLVFIDMHFVIDAYLEAKNRRIIETLHRATRFTEDVEGLNKGLANSAQDLQTSLEVLVSESDTAGNSAQKTFESLDEVTTQIKKMDERLEQLQFVDKLYTPRGKDGVFKASVKAFIEKYL